MPATPAAKATAAQPARTTGLHVLADDGTPVDWWFAYKISRDSKATDGSTTKATGAEYVYFDAAMATAGSAPRLSKNQIDTAGPLVAAYRQLFTPQAASNKLLGYICYNDEDRLDSKKKGTGPDTTLWGHCKGVLAFDLATDTAFWLIHSIPLLPMNAAWAYPPTGFREAQTLLCIQLPNVAATLDIAQLIYDAHGPNVNVASDMLTTAHDPKNNIAKPPASMVPGKLGLTDPRVRLMQCTNGSQGASPQPVGHRIVFTSRGGQQFTAIAKNRAWGNPAFDKSVTGPGQKDFYDILVADTLNENLDVETWVKGASPEPPPSEDGHGIVDRAGIDLSKAGIPWTWSENDDHAKLCISDAVNTDPNRWVCVGDINFTDSMELRGGGTVAFKCQPLWTFLNAVLVRGDIKGKRKSSTKTVAAPTKGTTTKGAPKKTSVTPARAAIATPVNATTTTAKTAAAKTTKAAPKKAATAVAKTAKTTIVKSKTANATPTKAAASHAKTAKTKTSKATPKKATSRPVAAKRSTARGK